MTMDNTTEKEITRMDLLLEYRDLPLNEIEFEHLDFDYIDMHTTYVLRDGDEYWNIRYLNPSEELIARETYVSCDPFAFVNISAFSGYMSYLSAKVISILKSQV